MSARAATKATKATDGAARVEGMTLRDYFAAQIIRGWLASYAGADCNPFEPRNAEQNARRAYRMADAMLRARSVGTP